MVQTAAHGHRTAGLIARLDTRICDECAIGAIAACCKERARKEKDKA